MKVSPQKASREIIMILPMLWSEVANFCVLSVILMTPFLLLFVNNIAMINECFVASLIIDYFLINLLSDRKS